MNTIHPNLQFTLERPNDNNLTFFDTEIKKIKYQLQTSVYRKSTDTNLFMQYVSTCIKAWKLGLMNFYLNRALKIISNFLTSKEELFKIKNLLLKNKCPKQLIETKINKFLEDYKTDNIFFKQNQTTKSRTKLNQENKNIFISRQST